MKKRKLIKFILLMGILLAISVPQQYAHAQDCDPATGAVCPPDPQSNPPQDNDEKEKKKTPTTMPATPTYTLQPPTSTATYTPQPPTSTATYTPQPPTSTATFTPFPPSPTSILVEAALPQAEPGNNSGAAPARRSSSESSEGSSLSAWCGLPYVHSEMVQYATNPPPVRAILPMEPSKALMADPLATWVMDLFGKTR